MAKPQPGILADASQFAIYLSLNQVSGHESLQRIRKFASNLPARQQALLNSAEGEVYINLAVGSSFWIELYSDSRPAELLPFPAMESGVRVAPSTPTDLFIQIRSNNEASNLDQAREILAELDGAVQVIEDIRGFRYHDSRDMTGFVDGTENPGPDDRADVALVGNTDPDFAAGSYLHVQRYEHNLKSWNKLPVTDQEATYGRSKADNIEFPSGEKSLHAHTKRTSLKDEQGNSIEIYRQSLPYGDTRVQGLMFLSYAASSTNFTRMLESMVKGDEQGHADNLLLYTRAVTGAAYFAPSIDWLESH